MSEEACQISVSFETQLGEPKYRLDEDSTGPYVLPGAATSRAELSTFLQALLQLPGCNFDFKINGLLLRTSLQQ